MFINYSEEKSRETGAFNTLKEIAQQPRLWKEANASLAAEQDRIKAFFKCSLTNMRKSMSFLQGPAHQHL
ncbi:hypothetical protein P7H06_19425 [Paenibacillus larvae]|nr:hypothetical protein [Paenibacillus larvae]MDT2261228.1 hypothetical protein [Paenibacillus larvae]MDT2293829.1 hypothetical protein [Paenibacillus larvae]